MSLVLFHIADAICAQKVRLALAEKGLDWESRLLAAADLRSPAYLRLNPNGYVPTLLHNGRILIESRVISEYIEDAFDGAPLLPPAAYARYSARGWTKQVDDSLHLNIYALSFAIVFREARLAMREDDRQRALPLTNPVKRAYTVDLTERGLASPYFVHAVERFVILLRDMDAALADSNWLGGEAYSLADCDLTPYLARLRRIGIYASLEPHFPHVARWFGAVESRPSFAAAITDWLSDEDNARTSVLVDQSRDQADRIVAAALAKELPA